MRINMRKSLLYLVNIILISYVLISLLRSWAIGERILSMDLKVFLISVMIAVSILVPEWLKNLKFVNERQAVYRFFLHPLGMMVFTYILTSLFRFAVLGDSLFNPRVETVSFSIAAGLFIIVEAKIDDLSPRKPEEEADKTKGDYREKFLKNATPFHKLMILVYGLCVLALVLLFIFMKSR